MDKKPRIAAIPGSFDPVTAGHVDIIRRAAAIFDKVYVVAMTNVDKTYLLTFEERLALLHEAVAGMGNVVAECFDGYFYEYAASRDVCAIVKGVRSADDFEYEREIAQFNRNALPSAETMLLFSSPGLGHISSSFVKKQAAQGADISAWVGPKCAEIIKSRLL